MRLIQPSWIQMGSIGITSVTHPISDIKTTFFAILLLWNFSSHLFAVLNSLRLVHLDRPDKEFHGYFTVLCCTPQYPHGGTWVLGTTKGLAESDLLLRELSCQSQNRRSAQFNCFVITRLILSNTSPTFRASSQHKKRVWKELKRATIIILLCFIICPRDCLGLL